MYSLVQKALFHCDPEWSHDTTLNWLKHTQHTFFNKTYAQQVAEKPVECLGLVFRNPVGLAAGLDKNGECIDAFDAMGFGFIEVGTVTPRAQPGNDKPRMFRLKQADAIINRMGFNNKGVDYLVEQVKTCSFKGVLGINIGKNKQTPEHEALDDYVTCLQKVYPHASYVTVNISSPNTPGLRDLQYGEALDNLLTGLKQQQLQLTQQHGKHVPLLVKIAPDLTDQQIVSIADSLRSAQIDGVIATNTTLDRRLVEGLPHAQETGGLSGAVMQARSLEVTKQLAKALQNELPIISVGGIDSSEAANQRFAAGAKLVQVYTGLIYKGPQLIKQVVDGVSHLP